MSKPDIARLCSGSGVTARTRTPTYYIRLWQASSAGTCASQQAARHPVQTKQACLLSCLLAPSCLPAGQEASQAFEDAAEFGAAVMHWGISREALRRFELTRRPRWTHAMQVGAAGTEFSSNLIDAPAQPKHAAAAAVHQDSTHKDSTPSLALGPQQACCASGWDLRLFALQLSFTRRRQHPVKCLCIGLFVHSADQHVGQLSTPSPMHMHLLACHGSACLPAACQRHWGLSHSQSG